MKKIMLIGLVTLLMASLVFAGDYNLQNRDMTISLNQGWNLIPLNNSLTPIGMNQVSDSAHPNDCTNHIKYIFVYSPIQKSYFGHGFAADYYDVTARSAYPSKAAYDSLMQTEFKYPNSQTNPYFGFMQLGAEWIYSDAQCSFSCTLGAANEWDAITTPFLQAHPIKLGWNFLTTSPWMIGKSFSTMFKNCQVLGVNSWDNSPNQKWINSSSATGASMALNNLSTVSNSSIGSTFVVKVASDCVLSLGEAPVSPPILPN